MLNDAAKDMAKEVREEAKEAREEAKDSKTESRTMSVGQQQFNYSSASRVGVTILSPHLETISTGSMIICLDNPDYSRSVHEPVSGKIKLNLKAPFDASRLTITLVGYVRSHF
jgi:hypothetical protein